MSSCPTDSLTTFLFPLLPFAFKSNWYRYLFLITSQRQLTLASISYSQARKEDKPHEEKIKELEEKIKVTEFAQTLSHTHSLSLAVC